MPLPDDAVELIAQHAAATLLQAVIRGYVRELLAQHAAATLLQAVFRGYRVRELLPPPLVDIDFVWHELAFVQFAALTASETFAAAVHEAVTFPMEEVD